MAVVYFTSNASTGAGSLAEAIQNAAPGDVVRPDETVFERGETIEIALASTLMVDKNLTFDASPFRVAVNGGSVVRCASVASGATASFTSFDFVGGASSSSGGGIYVDASSTLVLTRCRVVGCSAGSEGGGIYSRGVAALKDCVTTGCVARSANGGGISADGALVLDGSTVVGNSTGASGADVCATATLAASNSILGDISAGSTAVPDYRGCVVDVALSSVGFVASPPGNLTVENWSANAWENWDLRLLDDASLNPSPYRDSGDVSKMSQYDLDGNFRGRESDGVESCSPGAYETIQADLFWVGVDATGAEVVSPSFLTSDGWASSRFAIVSGDTAPQVGQKLFVDGAVVFGDVPSTTNGSTLDLVVGGGATVSTSSTTTVYCGVLTVGACSVYGFLTTPVKDCRVGAWARLTRRLLTTVACKFDVNAYVDYGYFYQRKVSPVPGYRLIIVVPTTLATVQLDGVYTCNEFRMSAEGTNAARKINVGESATIRARSVSFPASVEAPFETLFGKRVAVELQNAASATVGDGAPEGWSDAFNVDVSNATSATLKLNGQTIYGDAPACAVELSGSAKVDGTRSLIVSALALAEGAAVEFTNDASVILTTASATSATATGPGAFFAPIAAPVGLTLENGAVWGDTSAGVTSLDVDPVNATTATFTVVKTNADANIVAQFSDDAGATWRTVETTADVDEYELTVAQGADVTVRVAMATGWLSDTVSTAPLLPVWTVSNASESVVGVVNAFEVATGGSNDGLNVYDFNDYGYL